MAKVEKSIVITATPGEVWEKVNDPNEWHTWFEGISKATSVTGDGGPGTVVEQRITINKIPLPSKVTITQCDPGVCWKGEFVGPMNKGYMQWDYMDMGRRTRLTFTIEAELSGPAKLGEKLVVSSFEQMADQTLTNVKQMAEG